MATQQPPPGRELWREARPLPLFTVPLVVFQRHGSRLGRPCHSEVCEHSIKPNSRRIPNPGIWSLRSPGWRPERSAALFLETSVLASLELSSLLAVLSSLGFTSLFLYLMKTLDSPQESAPTHTHTALRLEPQDVHGHLPKRDPTENCGAKRQLSCLAPGSWWSVGCLGGVFSYQEECKQSSPGSLFLKCLKPWHPRTGPEPPESRLTSEARKGARWGDGPPRHRVPGGSGSEPPRSFRGLGASQEWQRGARSGLGRC